MTPQEKRLTEVANKVNEMAADFAVELSREFGEGGVEYGAAVISAATTLSFHAFRLGLIHSKENAIGILRVLLDDVVVNIQKTSGIHLEVEVHESRKI